MLLFAVPSWSEGIDKIVETSKIYTNWLELLDSDSSSRRMMAWNWLADEIYSLERAKTSQKSTELLLAIQDMLKRPEVSYEAQCRLDMLEQRILSQMDAQDVEKWVVPVEVVEESELKKLTCWRELLSDFPAYRNRAQREIENRIASGQNVDEVMRILREIVVENNISKDDRFRVWSLEKQARNRWLKSGNVQEFDCEYQDSQIQEWIDFIVTANLPEDRLVPWYEIDERVKFQFSISRDEDPFGGDGLPFLDFPKTKATTEGLKVWLLMQKLEDALISNKTAKTTLQYLEEKLNSNKVTPSGMILLKRLIFLTKPCMAAEYWSNGAMRSSQILQIGIPQTTQLGTSYFDRYNAVTVHCASGENLLPMDYPWDIAVRHPRQSWAFFHLKMLDTPSKKLLYAELMSQNSEERWRKITQKTLKQLDTEQKSRMKAGEMLDFENILLLELLEPREMSQYVACWLRDLPNMKGKEPEKQQSPFREVLKLEVDKKQSYYACLCRVLGNKGTAEAISQLRELLKNEPTWWEDKLFHFRVDFYAALAITARETWEGDEEWLKSLLKHDVALESSLVRQKNDSPMLSIQRDNPMVSAKPSQEVEPGGDLPTVAATAAGILLGRYKESKEGLEEVKVPWNQASELRIFRFKDEIARKEICEKLLNMP